MTEAQSEIWQAEKDLLADGRELLERLCATTRYRHLFPGGPNLALLFDAYQQLERHRVVNRTRRGRSFRDRWFLKRLLRKKIRRDALARDRRLQWGYPLPRPRRLRTGLPPVVRHALEHVDYDVRDDIGRLLQGEERGSFTADETISAHSRIEASLDRGLIQFRDALTNAALSDPSTIRSVHGQHIGFTSSAEPTKRRHPVAGLVLVKLPLQFMMILWIVFTTGYLGAYWFFNDQVLGTFLTRTLSPILDGELEFERVRWNPWLIADLITGEPHRLEVEGVRVYEPYKSLGKEKDEVTAYAEHLELSLTLHEIIPWNRIGVPAVLEIPWILHFSDVENKGELWVRVREYTPQGADRSFLSLVDAFSEPVETPPKYGYRKLSVRMDEAELDGARVMLDFRESADWGVDLEFEELDGELDFFGWIPDDGRPETLPFRWGTHGQGGNGTLWILGEELSAQDMALVDLGSGRRATPLGDMRVHGSGVVQGAPTTFDGFLREIFAENKSAAVNVSTTDLEPLANTFLPKPDDPQRPALRARGKPATLRVEGPFDDPSLRAVAQGITVDLFPDPAWAVDDADVSLVLTKDPVPELWEVDRVGKSPDDERWIVYLETLRGAALDGSMRLHGKGQLDHIVLAQEPDDPLLVSVYLDLEDINPGQLALDDPQIADLLQGEARGGAELHKLVLANGGGGDLERLDFFLHRAQLERDRSPKDDGLPRTLRADGDVLYDKEEGVDLRGLKISTTGGYVSASGGLSANWDTIKPTSLVARVDDGSSFLRAFGLDPYFDRLSAELNLAGPLFSPSGRDGSLSVSGVGSGGMSLTGISDARLWMDKGTLHVRSPNAGLFGGHGPLELDVVLFERGRALKDPRVRLFMDLKDVDRKNLLGSPIDAKGAELRLYVDDGNGEPVALSELQARGAAYAESLRIAGEQYRNASASFAFTREGVRIDQLTVAYHRPVSPKREPGVTVEVGTLTAKGNIGFDDDPELDVEIRANGLPLTALTSFVDADLPIRGQIARGSRIEVHGTASRPQINGHVELDSLSGYDIPLGRGGLDFVTQDVQPQSGPSHRAISVKGKLGSGGKAKHKLRWEVDADIAFGEPQRKKERGLEADVALRFASLPIANLLAQPERWEWREHVEGQLEDLEVRATYCEGGSEMLEACRGRVSDEEPTVTVAVPHAWIRPTAGAVKTAKSGKSVCNERATLCSETPFHARLDGDLLRLTTPWKLRSGGSDKATMVVNGTFDLSTPPAGAETCESSKPAIPRGGRGSARVEGQLDLAALAAVLAPYGFEAPEGRVDAALALDGHLGAPRLKGVISLPPKWKKVELDIEHDEVSKATGLKRRRSVPIELADLDIEFADSRVLLAGEAKVFNEAIRFGSRGGPRTQLTFSGACAGQYTIAAYGTLDGGIAHTLAPELIESSSGAADLERLHITGNLSDYDPDVGPTSIIDGASGEFSFGREALRLRLPYEAVTVAKGSIEFRRCGSPRPCAGAPPGSIALYIGGERGAGAVNRPRDALQLAIGDRGSGSTWGHIHFDPTVGDLVDARVRANVNRVPYLQSDNAGAPELVASLSSRNLVFERDNLGNMQVRGKVLVERSRWLRDAQQGVAILSFSDPVPAPPDSWPESIQNLGFDLQLQTTAPFRVDNNVLKKVEAEGEIALQGTLRDPELSGTINVDRGDLDLDILGEAYEIQEGKVRLDREIESSFVDIVAIGKEPKKIDEQLQYITLHLRGSLDEISWECSALGDVSNELGSTRGCVDYLIFDAGNVDATEQDVRRLGGTGLLYAGRPLTLVGKLTQVELNEYLEDKIPRLEQYLPNSTVRLGQLGVETEIETRPEWLTWGWGHLGFGFTYLRGYPGSLVRDTRSFDSKLEILDHTALEFSAGTRNYTNRVLILDPPNYRRLELLQNWQIPSAR
jgi:hypothetical protein